MDITNCPAPLVWCPYGHHTRGAGDRVMSGCGGQKARGERLMDKGC